MKTYKVVADLDSPSILYNYYQLSNKLKWIENSTNNSKQTSLQISNLQLDYSAGTGSLPADQLETDFNTIHPNFENTIFEELIKKYSMFRTRLMWVGPRSCYSIHKDRTKRIHIPLITNDQCCFVFPDDQEIYYLPVGKIYLVDTTKNHSFANFSNKSRLHIVGCVNY